jgi:YbgC/YbaW family acyl-CoA thioester hydrolase
MLCCRSCLTRHLKSALHPDHERISSQKMMDTSGPRIRTELQVMFFDTDCGGVVHNLAYLRFVEVARTLLAERLGLALAEMAQTQRYPVVVRTEIDYRRAAKLGDRLVVEAWLHRLERARFWCAFRILRPADEQLIAECRQMLALIEMPRGKLLRLPADWEKYRQAAGSFLPERTA